MRTYFDCIPCFLRQTLEAIRLVTKDETVQEKVLREVLSELTDVNLRESPPVMGQKIHRLIRKWSGSDDPYLEIKEKSNKKMMAHYPRLREMIQFSDAPLETAIRLAIAGNIIDYGTIAQSEDLRVDTILHEAKKAKLDRELVDQFCQSISAALNILFIGDNAGEIVFDRLLIENLPRDKITYVVRGGPVINDATKDDARAVGLDRIVRVMNNGTDAPGVVLSKCSKAFRHSLESADLVISKGQGNYEGLSGVNKEIYHLLRVKCQVIANDLKCSVGKMLFERNHTRAGKLS